MRWWTVPELRDAIKENGRSRDDAFRPYFVPVIQQVLKYFDAVSDQCDGCNTEAR